MLTESDKEIVQIIKELFRSKKGSLMCPNELFQENVVKFSIYFAIFCSVVLLPIQFYKDLSQLSDLLTGSISVAFTFLFIHLNIKSKNPSFILYFLTWLSLMLGLWL